MQDVGLQPGRQTLRWSRQGRGHRPRRGNREELYSVAGEAAGFSADGKTLFVMGEKGAGVRRGDGQGTQGASATEDEVGLAPRQRSRRTASGTPRTSASTSASTTPRPASSRCNWITSTSRAAAPSRRRSASNWSGRRTASRWPRSACWSMTARSAWPGGKSRPASGSIPFAADFTDGPRAVAFSSDSKSIAIGYEKRIDVWTGGLNPVKNLGEHGLGHGARLLPGRQELAAGIRLPIFHGGDKVPRVIGHKTEVRLIDIATDKVVKVFDGFEGVNHMAATKLPVTALAFSPDGKKLLAGTGILNMTEIPTDVPKSGELKVVRSRSAARPPGPLENAALRKFQGTWKLDGFELGGDNKLTEEEIKAGLDTDHEGNKFQLADKNGKDTSSGRIAVDDSQKPPVLVRIVTDRDNDLYTWCLYELDGDTLRLCQDVHQKGKPKEFKATADTTIATYKRVKK